MDSLALSVSLWQLVSLVVFFLIFGKFVYYNTPDGGPLHVMCLFGQDAAIPRLIRCGMDIEAPSLSTSTDLSFSVLCRVMYAFFMEMRVCFGESRSFFCLR
jgi:hypothetical protein